MELTIDTHTCDLGTELPLIPGFDSSALADPAAARSGRQLRLTLPRTPRNAALLCEAEEPYAGRRFNDSLHRAELTAEGARMLGGTVRLLAVTDDGYEIEIRDGGARWAENAARRRLHELDVDYSATLTPTTVCSGWSDDSPVKFFPVHRDDYPQQNGSLDLLPAERLLSVDDYHPFLHVATLVERLFEEAGYRIRSNFLASELFRSLYMSGAYASHDTAAAEARMGFLAGRTGPVTARADALGRVYANPASQLNSVGNIVETASPQRLDDNGEPLAELFNHGNCFSIEEGAIRFTPPTDINVGFEYRLRYTTDHLILSRTRLRGFDSFYLGPGTRMEFALANRYADRREKIVPGQAYRIIVFDHSSGDSYRLTCTRDGIAGSLWCDFEGRSHRAVAPAATLLASPALQVRRNGSWIPYDGDWALYDGHIGERGQTTVEVRLRTTAEQLSPSAPKLFHRIFLYGAEPGMAITLHRECTLRPCFLPGPGFGSQIAFADVSRHGIRQIVLLEALAHLFNLRFFTEQESRTVWIEPADDLFGSGPLTDWSDRTDLACPVETAQIVTRIHELRTWGYRPGAGAVARAEEEPGSFGRWSSPCSSPAAMQGEQVRLNPLFQPVLNSVGHYLNAPSARMLQVGDRDAPGTGEFGPLLIRFAGMRPLPDGERWGYPATLKAYPLAAFHAPDNSPDPGFTLCFEDRDGVTGLHRFYDRQVAREASQERITLTLRIDPDEFEALFNPGTGAADIRSPFRIDTGRGSVTAILHAIEGYDPESRRMRCTFDRIAREPIILS